VWTGKKPVSAFAMQKREFRKGSGEDGSQLRGIQVKKSRERGTAGRRVNEIGGVRVRGEGQGGRTKRGAPGVRYATLGKYGAPKVRWG